MTDARFTRVLEKLVDGINSGHGYEEVLPRLFAALPLFLPCDRMALAFLHADSETLVLGPVFSKNTTTLMTGFREPVHSSLLKEVITSRAKQQILNDYSRCTRAHRNTHSIRVLAREGMRASLAVPLTVAGKVAGALWLCSRNREVYDKSHAQFARLIAGHLAMILARGRMLGRVTVDRQLKHRLQDENTQLREAIVHSPLLSELIGVSYPWKKTLQKVELVAGTESTVLIRGETGTGKELIARAIHRLSTRKDKPFVAINCGALSPELVSSELFGHERGAFTGALQRKFGRLELAEGGTLFLDEVAELPPDLQVKLLRVLQEREFERVGGTQTIKANVRVIAATHRNLEKLRGAGGFRDDLYFRLNVFPILVPPLRERKEDIDPLLNYFLARYSQKMNKVFAGVDPQVLERCYLYHWPGNIRELENLVERGVILSQGTFYMDPLLEAESGPKTAAGDQRLDAVIKAHIIDALKRTHGKVYGIDGAAARLGLKPSTLQAKMRKYALSRRDAFE